MIPVIIFIKVDFPAPLIPNKPYIFPWGIAKSIFDSTVRPLKTWLIAGFLPSNLSFYDLPLLKCPNNYGKQPR